MKLQQKPLEVGDSVRAKYMVEVYEHETEIFIDGELIELDEDDENHPKWLIEYRLKNVIGAEKYQNWWHEDDITTKHYVRQ